ncbi:hypothetical protein [Pseudomonas sp. Irchel 3E20]|uniref:hypothetical protein n=1 Tax=Pseudomonas sp. Irchel 3E20 TaxID=2008983 RepID=UPI0015960EA4
MEAQDLRAIAGVGQPARAPKLIGQGLQDHGQADGGFAQGRAGDHRQHQQAMAE